MKKPTPIPESPVLVIRWIADMKERDEISEIREAVGGRYPINTLRARAKDEVYRAFELWLKTASPRILYLGAHGTRRGLVDRRKNNLELMTWEQLGSHLASVPSAFQNPVVLVLGACYSSLAPNIWTKLGLRIPVSHVICIAEEPRVSDVVQMIVQILIHDKDEEESLKGPEQEITYLDESISALRGSLPSSLKLRLFLRGDRSNGNRYAFVEVQHLGEQHELQRELVKRTSRRKESLLHSGLLEGMTEPVPSKDDLEAMKERARLLNRTAVDDTNNLQQSRPLPGSDVRERKRRLRASTAIRNSRGKGYIDGPST